jgi:hypothetical protein
MVMDLLLKIIALDRNEGGQGIVEVCHKAPVLLILNLNLCEKAHG